MIAIDFITGLVFGLEHFTGELEEDINYAITLHLGIIRISYLSLKSDYAD